MRIRVRSFAVAVMSLLCCLSVLSPSLLAADAAKGYQPEATVSVATRLDAIFPLANQSPAKPPDGWLEGYDSSRQTYELYVPKAYSPKKAWPVVLFVSPSSKAMGWAHWQQVCEKQGVIFAGPHAAGNDCPTPRRVRIVMDVLDDVRRKYRTDVERTYIGGFSGGGRIACAIAFALPENFGGVIPVCAAGDLREESWLRDRVIRRLSVAHVTGDTDFNRGEVERYRGPMLAELGVRSKIWVMPKMGHSVPTGAALLPVYKWLDEAAEDRAELSKKYPASHMPAEETPTREEQATALLAEAKSRLNDPKKLYIGLMQLSGIRTRWADLPEAKEATTILSEYDNRDERPWEQDDLAEQRKFLIAKAHALDAYATGPLPDQYKKQKVDMLKGAQTLWLQVVKDGQDEKAVAEGQKRLIELSDLIQEEE